MNYRAARQTRYRYKLEGFDDDWIEIDSTKRLVTYTNLAPSRYVFRVASANADGVWNPAGRAIALIITPPWWTTWWFRGLAFALVSNRSFLPLADRSSPRCADGSVCLNDSCEEDGSQ